MRNRALGLLLLLTAGCGGEEEIRLYWVPKQHVHAGHDHDHGSAEDTRPTPEDASWTLPAGWSIDPEQRPMRYATFHAGDVEVAVTQFPGEVGTLLQNVERWRNQLGLPAGAPNELQRAVTELQHPDAEAARVDLQNPDTGQRLWVALLRRPHVTWFVKTQGEVAQVEAVSETLTDFVRSLRFRPGTRASMPPDAGMPPAGPPGGVTPVAARPAWRAPAGWREAAAQPPRVASYALEGGAEATVTSFPGQVGDLLSNVNRWRGQLGLDPLGDLAQLRPQPARVQVGDAAGTLVELRADGRALLVAFAQHGEQTWFFKLSGDEAVIQREAPAFTAWVESVDFHGEHGSSPHTPGAGAGPPTPPAAPFAFALPPGWTDEQARPPRLLTLRTAQGAELSVTRFPGAVGTLQSNLDRWRGQLGLPPGGSATPAAVSIGGVPGQVVELAGPDQAMRVALITHEGQTWFFKLMGPTTAVEADRDAFGSFLASVELR